MARLKKMTDETGSRGGDSISIPFFLLLILRGYKDLWCLSQSFFSHQEAEEEREEVLV